MTPFEVSQMKAKKQEKLRKLKGQVAEAEEQARQLGLSRLAIEGPASVRVRFD